MKSAVVLLAIVIVVACLALLDLRVGVGREEATEIVPTARLEATPVIEGRPGVEKGIVESTTRVETVVPGPAREGSLSHTQSDTDDVDGAVPKFGPLDAMSLSDAMTNAVDTSVIGRRFIVSPDTTPECMEPEEGASCERKRRIEQFTGEPRDPAWASRAESLLRSMVEERNSGFSIRNLECRLITCIMEVESTERVLGQELALNPEDWLAVKVKPFGVETGDEAGPLGRGITLTLWIYQRIR
jgi:hypothetical protein